jgi:hypothetical protein
MPFARVRHRFLRIRAWLADRGNLNLCFSLSSILIALGALFLSSYQGCQTRQHDRLSVKPHLMISYYYNDKGVGWYLINDGLGPAHIRGFQVFVNEVPQPATNILADVLKPLHLPLLPKDYVSFSNPLAGEYIATTNGGVPAPTLIWITPGDAAAALTRAHGQVGFELCYCSIYDDCWLLRGATTTRDDSCSTFAIRPLSNWWAG